MKESRVKDDYKLYSVTRVIELPSFEMQRAVGAVSLVLEMEWSWRAEQRHLVDIQVGKEKADGCTGTEGRAEAWLEVYNWESQDKQGHKIR